MSPEYREKLRARVVRAAEQALERQHFVSPIDVLTGIGWLHPSTVARWQQGQTPFLEQDAQVDAARLFEAMTLLRAWATERGLLPSETAYVARTPGRPRLQFSASGDAAVESLYRTHWLSPALSEKKREQLAQKASRPPELVVIQPLDGEWKCHRCGGAGDLLVMEPPGPACLPCVGLGALEYLPAGDAALSRKAKAASATHAVVVRFSRSRKRYERQGLLVEPAALRAAYEALGLEPPAS